jgi:hypothetical protein
VASAWITRLCTAGSNAPELEKRTLWYQSGSASRGGSTRPTSASRAGGTLLRSFSGAAAGSVLQGWAGLAAALRNAGLALFAPPAFGISAGRSGSTAVSRGLAHELVTIFDAQTTIAVGNPRTETETIDRLRCKDHDGASVTHSWFGFQA